MSLGIYAIVSPDGGAYHTYYENIFYTRFLMQSYDEKIVDLLLENQTRYQFILCAVSSSNVKANVVITDPDGDELSILDFIDHEVAILGEFITNEEGNYSIGLKALDEGSSYLADFSIAERFDEYYPEGGRYAGRNKSIRLIKGTLLVISGICISLACMHAFLTKRIEMSRREVNKTWLPLVCGHAC